MFSFSGTLKKSGSVGRWETKQFIGMALVAVSSILDYEMSLSKLFNLDIKVNLQI